MNKTLNEFKISQAKSIFILNEIEEFLKEGEEFGVRVSPEVQRKLSHAISNVSDQKLKVALIGGFSEGKTSIAAAWIGKFDRQTMKISHQESSNEVRIYDIDNEIQLIDTPGLFGFKEQENSETFAKEKYKDITKNYVSEAHLVLYVMNSTNPIKESHREDLTWLFKELDLLPRTVFVLSRFDEVADVEDDAEFNESFEIKRVNVSSRLAEILRLNSEEISDLSIAAVAANPFDLGAEYWLKNREKFDQISRIPFLQRLTAAKISTNGGFEKLASEAKKSIIRDIISNKLPEAIDTDEKITKEVNKLSLANSHLQGQLKVINQHISTVQIELRDFVTKYFSGLILQLNGTDLDTFTQFYEREVGNSGVMITSKLQSEFQKALHSVNNEIDITKRSYEEEISHYNSTLSDLGKQGMNFALKNNFVNQGVVLAARDGIVKGAQFIGLDIASMLKFKPWGAVNLAKGINGVLAAAGLALEAWDSWQEAKKKEEFLSALSEMKNNFEKQREELLMIINSSDFSSKFFPEYVQLSENLNQINEQLKERNDLKVKFGTWRKKIESISSEFYRV